MELDWDSRLIQAQNWAPSGPGPSTTSPLQPTTTSLSQRRRSSAAHTRPAVPPPNVPIPNIPDSDTPPLPPQSTYSRQTASPNLTAVAAFSQSRIVTVDPPADELSDPPPPSILPQTSSRLAPPDANSMNSNSGNGNAESRPPSSRRALTRALELAREAVQLDSTNDNPEAAVKAYARSVALLSEVMERVRRGEDTTEPRRRNGRRRSVVAQEEEIRRLQSIHDTYADRMNILSIIYSIPPAPYSTSSTYTVSTDSMISQSSSPSSDSPEYTAQGFPSNNNANRTAQDDSDLSEYLKQSYEEDGEKRGIRDEEDAMGAIGAAMFAATTPSPVHATNSAAQSATHSGLPMTSSAHPYAIAQPSIPPSNRTSIQPPRRPSRASVLPPPTLPPPVNSLPPAPSNNESALESSKHHLDVVTRQRGDSIGTGHRRTPSGSRLAALEEEEIELRDQSPLEWTDDVARASSKHVIPDAILRKQESPPLPPIPSPTASSIPADSPNIPRSTKPSAVTSSPQSIIVPRPRGSSTRSEIQIINTTTSQGTIFQRRSVKTSNPSTPRSSSPADSTTSAGSVPYPRSTASSLPGGNGAPPVIGRSRSSSQPGRRPSIINGRVSPVDRPPLPNGAVVVNGSIPVPQRKTSFGSKLNPHTSMGLHVQTDFTSLAPPHILSGGMPSTPTSPLPPQPPADPLRKPYHLMNLLRTTMISGSGGYITRRLHVPQEVWSQGGAKLSNLIDKIRVVGILFSALEDLQNSSSEYFGAGNVSSGMALGIGSIGRKEGEAWIAKLEDFSSVCDGVVANFGKKLGVGEGFVVRKTTWGDKLGRRFDKFTTGKNLDSPAAYVQGLKKLFLHAQLLDEHTKAVTSQPLAPAYASFPADIRSAAEIRLRRSSEFFASVVLTFVVRDLSQLLDKYAKKCEKWLEE